MGLRDVEGKVVSEKACACISGMRDKMRRRRRRRRRRRKGVIVKDATLNSANNFIGITLRHIILTPNFALIVRVLEMRCCKH